MLRITSKKEIYLGKKKIGELDGDTFITHRDSGRHIFLADSSIGFNYTLMKTKLFDKVRIYIDFQPYHTTRKEIVETGKVRKFRENELQIFFPLNKLKKGE